MSPDAASGTATPQEPTATTPDGGPESPVARSFNRVKVLVVAGIIAAIGAVVAALLITIGDPVPQTVETQIVVREVLNRVEADRPRTAPATYGNFLPAVAGQELVPGDGVKTYADSEARVDIAVGDFVRVSRTKPNTLWRLGQFAMDKGAVIELDQGTIFLFDDSGDTDPRPIKIITPAGIASPRGTWMKIGYDPVSEETELQCFRGTCVLENDLGTQVLVDEQKSVATTKLPPAEPVEMSEDETQEFVELPEVESGEVVIPVPGPINPDVSKIEDVEDVNEDINKEVPISAPVDDPEAGVQSATNPSQPSPVTEEPVDPPEDGSTTDAAGPTAASLEPEATPAPEPTLAPEPSPEPKRRPVPVVVISTPRPMPTRYPTPVPYPTATPLPSATPEPVIVALPPINSSVLPHIFVGTAVLNGEPAPYGTVISAWMAGFSEPLAKEIVSGDSFTILVSQYGAQSMNGKIVEFRLDGLPAEPTGTWIAGGADILVIKSSTN